MAKLSKMQKALMSEYARKLVIERTLANSVQRRVEREVVKADSYIANLRAASEQFLSREEKREQIENCLMVM